MEIIEILEELLPIEHPFLVSKIEKDEESKEVHIHLEVDESYRPNSDCGGIHQYYPRKWEHLKLFEYRSFLHCRLPIYKDIRTGKTQAMQVEFSRKYSRFTLLYEQELMRLMRLHLNSEAVAAQLQIAQQRVEDIYYHYLQPAYEAHTVEICEKVGLDETSTRKGHNYISVFVNMDTGKPIDIQDGKGIEVVEEFFHNHPNPTLVTDISIDMSPAFISGCESFFPWARATFDKWHVFKLLGKHLDNLYKRFKATEHREALFTLSQGLADFYQLKDWMQAKAMLLFLADFAQFHFGNKNSFSKSIRRHFDGIVEHMRSKLNNGLLEGINSKIQTIKRIAKGFKNIENFKIRILFAFDVIHPQFYT